MSDTTTTENDLAQSLADEVGLTTEQATAVLDSLWLEGCRMAYYIRGAADGAATAIQVQRALDSGDPTAVEALLAQFEGGDDE